jgi:hypothetical protein
VGGPEIRASSRHFSCWSRRTYAVSLFFFAAGAAARCSRGRERSRDACSRGGPSVATSVGRSASAFTKPSASAGPLLKQRWRQQRMWEALSERRSGTGPAPVPLHLAFFTSLETAGLRSVGTGHFPLPARRSVCGFAMMAVYDIMMAWSKRRSNSNNGSMRD